MLSKNDYIEPELGTFVLNTHESRSHDLKSTMDTFNLRINS